MTRTNSVGQAVENPRTRESVKHALDQAAIVAVTDAAGRILEVNDKFCEISQYAREELVGQDHRLVNSGHHPKAFMTGMWRTIANGEVWRGEVLNRAKDGHLYWVDTTIVPLRDERGTALEYFAIHYDITARKRAEAELREKTTLAQIGEMAAVVAHEVKNPLAGIGGALQVLDRRLALAPQDREVVAQIQARLQLVNGMVEDLLFFAQPPPLRMTVMSVRTVLERAAVLFAAHPHRGEVTLEVRPRTIAVRADAEQLAFAVCHILVNAAQAMHGRGQIALSVTETRDRCMIEVRDSGAGIQPEMMDRLFQPFATTKTQGRGLGLAVARRIVEQHRGHVDIQSVPEGGTAVTFVLPACDQAA